MAEREGVREDGNRSPFGSKLDQGRVVGVEDRIEQAGEAAVDVFLAQLGVALGALDALGDQALSQLRMPAGR